MFEQRLKKTLLGGSVLSALLSAQIATAQTVPQSPASSQADTGGALPDQEVPTGPDLPAVGAEEVVVTGFRSSIARALEAKRNAANFQDTILAADIGKFPELNLAESLARIPGVQISRSNGEGRQVSLRGLGPDFTRVTLNGLPISPATGDGGGRDVAFDIFPSELFSRITVNKSARPSLIEGGLAGNIDLANARPFDTQGFTLSYTAKAQYQEQNEKIDPRATLLISQNWDNRFGILVGGFYSKRRYQFDSYETQGWTRPRIDLNGNGSYDANETASTGFQFATPEAAEGSGVSPEALADSRFPRLARPISALGERERLGVVASAQYRPTDTLLLNFDGFYAKLKEPKQSASADWALRNSRDLVPENLVLDDNGTLVSGRFHNVDLYGLGTDHIESTDFYQGVFSGEWSPNADLTIDAALGYSRTKWDRDFSLFTFRTPPSSGLSLDYALSEGGAGIPTITTNFDITDASLYELAEIRNQPYNADSETLSGRLNMRVGSADTNLRLGIAYDREDRYRQRRQMNGRPTLFQPDFQQSEVPGLVQLSPSDYLRTANPPLGFAQWLKPNIGALDDRFDLQAMQDAAPLLQNATGATDERILSGYMEVNGLTQIAGRDLRVSGGVRVTHTDQTVSSPFGTTEIEFQRDYVEALPSVNLTYDITDDLLFRFAAARAMTRPVPSTLEPTTNIDLSGNVTQNNPNLDPYFSNQIDVGLEWYFAPRSVLAANFFYKNISGFIESVVRQAPFREAGIPIDQLTPVLQEGLVNGLDTLVNFNSRENVDSDQVIKGLEVAYQQPLDFLVDGIGVLANVTYLDSSDAPRVTGLAEFAYNIVGYYERGPVSFRTSYNNRGRFITCAGPCTDGLPEQSYTRAQGYLDLAASYKLPVNFDISLTLDALNLTNEIDASYSGFDNRLIDYQRPGRIVLVGLRGSF